MATCLNSSRSLTRRHGREDLDAPPAREARGQDQQVEVRDDEADDCRELWERRTDPRRADCGGVEEAQREVRPLDSLVRGMDAAPPRSSRRDSARGPRRPSTPAITTEAPKGRTAYIVN